jgi:hypothetical protein
MRSFHRLKKEVGLRILDKYEWKCTECGSNKKLCVHHVERRDIKAIDYNDEKNLTVLCRKCHMSYHRKAGHVQPEWNGHVNIWGRRGKGNPPVKCRIKGCDNFQHAKRLCKKHYERIRLAGLKAECVLD